MDNDFARELEELDYWLDNLDKIRDFKVDWSNKEQALEALKRGLSPSIEEWNLIDDREIALEIIKQNAAPLRLGKKYKDDREIMLAAAGSISGPYQFRQASKALRDDRDFVLEAVKRNGMVLEYLRDERKCDKEIVLAAVKQNGYALRYASEELLNDSEFMEEARKVIEDSEKESLEQQNVEEKETEEKEAKDKDLSSMTMEELEALSGKLDAQIESNEQKMAEAGAEYDRKTKEASEVDLRKQYITKIKEKQAVVASQNKDIQELASRIAELEAYIEENREHTEGVSQSDDDSRGEA